MKLFQAPIFQNEIAECKFLNFVGKLQHFIIKLIKLGQLHFLKWNLKNFWFFFYIY